MKHKRLRSLSGTASLQAEEGQGLEAGLGWAWLQSPPGGHPCPHSQPLQAERARAQAGLGWHGLNPPASADNSRLPAPAPQWGKHRVCWTAVLHLPWMLLLSVGQARDDFPSWECGLCTTLAPSLGWMPTHGEASGDGGEGRVSKLHENPNEMLIFL